MVRVHLSPPFLFLTLSLALACIEIQRCVRLLVKKQKLLVKTKILVNRGFALRLPPRQKTKIPEAKSFNV